jgi:hypothetical protein
MGDLRPDGGGLPPDDGGSHGEELPDFPPEWGPVIIPDDASELDPEADALRRELRRHARQATLRTALGLRPSRVPTGQRRESPLGVPAMIMAVAMLTTLISLFVVVWGNHTSGPGLNSPSAHAPVPATTNVSDDGPDNLTDIPLTDADHNEVRLGSLLPAVILLAEHCDCTTLVTELAQAAPKGVTIVPVASTVTRTDTQNIRAMSDPGGRLSAKFAVPSHPNPPSALVVLLDRSGAVVATHPSVRNAAELSADLGKLAEPPST